MPRTAPRTTSRDATRRLPTAADIQPAHPRSRAPLAKLQAYKQRLGWTFPWASSLGSDFNFEFSVHVTEEQQREGSFEYNYRRGGYYTRAELEVPVAEPIGNQNARKFAAMSGTDVPRTRARGRA